MATKLSKEFIQKQQKRLIAEKEKITIQIEKLKADDPFSDPDYSNDNAAVDTDVREQEYHAIVEAQINDLKKRLKDIDLAIRKIDKGTYGICEKCSMPIPLKRLELIPEARYDMDCEKKLRK